MEISRRLVICEVLILWSFASLAYAVQDMRDTIPIDTKITMQNWQQYRQFMPDGMIALFEGKYFWKMPSDVEMNIGPTRAFAAPPGYVAATEKYGRQTGAVVLPDGRHDLLNYVGGLPFPDPAEPYMGWKILANDWLPPVKGGQPRLHPLWRATIATKSASVTMPTRCPSWRVIPWQ
jgi:hypothetical protein